MQGVIFLVQLASGILGAHLVATRWPRVQLGTFGNGLAGVVGGALGGVMLNGDFMIPQGPAVAALDPGTIVAQVAGGGTGGALVLILVGVLNRTFAR